MNLFIGWDDTVLMLSIVMISVLGKVAPVHHDYMSHDPLLCVNGCHL